MAGWLISLTHDLPSSFALSGLPVHVAASQRAPFSLGRQQECDETHMDDYRGERCARSFKWYQSLFGQPATSPGHPDFGQLLDSDGTVLLCLHEWRAHEHPSLMSPDEASPGNGLLLFFRVDDFDMALKRARTLVTRFEEEPHMNPNTQTQELSLRDPDGYYVAISALPAPQRKKPARRRPNKRLRPAKAGGQIRKSREKPPRLRG